MMRALVLSLCGLAIVGPVAAQDAPATKPAPPVKAVKPVTVTGETVTVTYNPSEMIKVPVRVDYTTRVVLPEGEGIMSIEGGNTGVLTDKTSIWPITYVQGQNFFTVRSALEGNETNLFVLSSSNRTYEFLLTEVGKLRQPKLRVTVLLGPDQQPAAAPVPAPKFYTAAEVALLTADLDRARAEVVATQTAAAQQLAAATQAAHQQIRHYAVPSTPPFNIEAMWTDGVRTMIRTTAPESWVLYEMKDGKPSEVNVQREAPGLYLVMKVLGNGYVKLGTKRLAFTAPTAMRQAN